MLPVAEAEGLGTVSGLELHALSPLLELHARRGETDEAFALFDAIVHAARREAAAAVATTTTVATAVRAARAAHWHLST